MSGGRLEPLLRKLVLTGQFLLKSLKSGSCVMTLDDMRKSQRFLLGD